MKPIKILLVLFALVGGTLAAPRVQDVPEDTVDILAEIDMANQVLPLLMTKAQINEMLLTIEQCRADVQAQEKNEVAAINRLRAEATKTHGEAVVKGLTPSNEFMAKVTALFDRFENERTGVAAKNMIRIASKVSSLLNAGQKKAIVGVVDKVYDEETEAWVDGTDERKIAFFCNRVFLSEFTYSFLRRHHKALD